jgi:hypothetical protein
MRSDDAFVRQHAMLVLAQLEDQLGNHAAAQPLYKQAALGLAGAQLGHIASEPLN